MSHRTSDYTTDDILIGRPTDRLSCAVADAAEFNYSRSVARAAKVILCAPQSSREVDLARARHQSSQIDVLAPSATEKRRRFPSSLISDQRTNGPWAGCTGPSAAWAYWTLPFSLPLSLMSSRVDRISSLKRRQ